MSKFRSCGFESATVASHHPTMFSFHSLTQAPLWAKVKSWLIYHDVDGLNSKIMPIILWSDIFEVFYTQFIFLPVRKDLRLSNNKRLSTSKSA